MQWILCVILCVTSPLAVAMDGFGATLQIYTRFHTYVGKPQWLLMIYDADHGQMVPYLFDIHRGDNMWTAFTYSHDYEIVASTLQISTYQSNYNRFVQYTVNDFCHLETHGVPLQGESMYIIITGNLTLDANNISCQISRY